jgi:3-dehydroquinate dehydratase-2
VSDAVQWPDDGRPVVLLLSGPNLNLLGDREPHIYGTATLDDHVATARATADRHGLALAHVQSNREADLVEAVHAARRRAAAIVLHAAALTHYSWALHDALAAFEGVKVELHLSNTHARERWRHTSVVAPVVHGSVQGFGPHGYELAVLGAARLLGVG